MSMIKIIDGYSFTFDGSCYTLFNIGQRYKIDRKTRKQTDELCDFTDTIGYFSSMDAMLDKCLKVAANDLAISQNCDNLKDYIDCVKEIFDNISNFTESQVKNDEVACSRKPS